MNINSFKNYSNLNTCNASSVVQQKVAFQAKNNQTPEQKKYDNPVRPAFEYLGVVLATIIAGIGVAARVMLEVDPDFYSDIFKNKGKTGINKTVAALIAVPTAIALVYTAFKLPKNVNNKRKEIFVEKKEFDVYSRSNSAEKNMLERLETQIKEAKTPEERDRLSKQYALLKMSHQKAPVYNKTPGPLKAFSDGFFVPERTILNRPGL